MSNVPPPIYSVLASDPDLQEIVQLFVDEMSDRIARFEAEFAAKNWAELGRAAHQLKGAAGSYGFAELSPAAATLENTIKANADEATISAATDHLIALCRRTTANPEPN